MKKLIVLIVILGVLVGGYYGWKNWQKASAASAAPERPTTATVELRSINFAVNAAGEIAPAERRKQHDGRQPGEQKKVRSATHNFECIGWSTGSFGRLKIGRRMESCPTRLLRCVALHVQGAEPVV